MICRRSVVLALTCALAACHGPSAETRAPDDWRAKLAAGDGIGAEAALRRAVESGTPAPVLAPWLGEAELQQGDLHEAERWLSGGEFAPETAAHGFHMLGRLRMRQGDLPAAGRAFDRALAANSDSPELWVDIGRLRWRGGEQRQAIEAAERALAHAPDDPAALLFRAQLMRESGGNAQALPLLEQALGRAPGNPDVLAEYAATQGELGRAADMLVTIRRLSQSAPGDARTLYLQAVLAARAGRFDLARGLLQRSGDADRQGPAAVLLLLAIVDMENENYASAAQGLDALARRQPDNRRVRFLLARALALGGNHRELIARFETERDSPYLAELVGRAHEALGQRDKAAPYLDAARSGGALRIVPISRQDRFGSPGRRGAGEGTTVVGLVRGFIGRGRGGEARAASRAFLRTNAGSADAAALAGDAALASGDARGAVAYYARAAGIRRNWPLVKRMAAALDRSGRGDEATEAIAAHLAAEPANADAAALLARRMYDRGDTQRARALAEYARSRGRNDPLLGRFGES